MGVRGVWPCGLPAPDPGRVGEEIREMAGMVAEAEL